MRVELIFLIACFSSGMAMISWKLIISPVLRDRRVKTLAKIAKMSGKGVEVTISAMPLPGKLRGDVRQSERDFNVQAADEHWYFSLCTFWTPAAVTKLKDGAQAMMYTGKSDGLIACCIEVNGSELLGTLSEEIPKN